MKFLFHNDTAFNKISKYVSDTWMCLKRGEGEEEIANHGRSRVKSFSQETGATGQQSHGVTILSRSYTLKSQVQDARDSQTQLPFFSSSERYQLPFGKKTYTVILSALLSMSGVARAEFMTLEPNKNKSASTTQVSQAQDPQKDASLKTEATANAVDRSKFKALPNRFMKAPVQKSADQKLHDVSEMYEKHFLREMLKAMRSTVHESGFVQQNQAEKIFREQLDDHYVDKWSEKGGIGLSKLIYEQLIDKFGVQMGIKKAVTKPQGPLPLDEKSNYTAHQFQHPGKKQALSYRIDKRPVLPGALQEKPEVKSPWDGVLLGTKTLADHQTLLEIEHDNGLKSQVVFKGGLSKVSTGDKIQAGETLGVLSPEAKSLYWTVEQDESTGPKTVSE